MCGKIKLMDSRNSQVDRCLNFISSLFGGKTERKFLKTSENIDEKEVKRLEIGMFYLMEN
jgi:hypothetical protein